MIARPEDEAEVLAYFDESPDETVWLRIAWQDKAGFVLSRAQGHIVGVAAYTGQHVVQVHARSDVGGLAKEVVRSGEKVVAVAGLPEQMRGAIEALGLSGRPVARLSREISMSVELDKLVLPELLSQPGVVTRRATQADVFLLIDWRLRYFDEVHHTTPSPQVLSEVSEATEAGRLWVLEVNGEIVNTAAFSAVFPHLVQIEYAYGPKELRAKKYGRSVVAGALAAVKPQGITRAVFNTDEHNVSVQTGIQPIGFRKTGDHHVTVFADQA
jgi:predicted GNAT family acetyltransferase